MSDVLVRDVSPALHGALKDRARRHGRSLSAEIKDILGRSIAEAREPDIRLGTMMVETFRNAGNVDLTEVIRRRRMERVPDPTKFR